MYRIEEIHRGGAVVLLVDLSNLSEVEEIKALLAEAAGRFREGATGPVLALIDVRGVPYSLRIVRMLGEAAAANDRYVHARAVVGVPPTAASAAAEIARFSETPVELFDTREEAVGWLLEQRASGRP